MATTTTAATVLVEVLRSRGADRVFCVAGESYLAVLDALASVPGIDVVTCRHEGSATFMALAEAKITGRAGVVLVNRGPGATNAAIALHSALLDATPLVLVMGHVRSGDEGRDAFQELDPVSGLGGLAKRVIVLRDARHAAEAMAEALSLAQCATPGPVVLAVPEDVLDQPADSPASWAGQPEPWVASGSAPTQDGMARVLDLMAGARRPLLVGGSRLATPGGRAGLAAAAHRHELPVAVSNKRQDLFDNADPLYAGHMSAFLTRPQRELVASADLVLAVGTRLGYVTTGGYRVPAAPVPAQPLVHVYPDPHRIGSRYRPTVGLACDPAAFLRALADAGPVTDPAWADWTARLHDREVEATRWQGHTAGDGVVFGSVIAELDRLAPADAVVTVDAGNFASWVHRHFRCTGSRRLLSIASAAMGFGVPAAVSAALRAPDRPVIGIIGDGGFLMTGSELATAVQREARVILVVADNGSYGTIRQHQERHYPGRPVGTRLANPDFAALARAYGALGLSVRTDDEVPGALDKALQHDGPVVVHVRTSLAWIHADQYLPELDITQ